MDRMSFVFGIILVTTLGWVITSWIRARYGYPVSNEWGVSVDKSEGPSSARQIELLSTENERLKGQITRLEERLAVLERIATDPAERTAREIENLR
jgi:cell division protein FtsB